MKIGWLVYEHYYDDDNIRHETGATFHKFKPDYFSGELVQIAYMEVVE